jgi:hypothetical protein
MLIPSDERLKDPHWDFDFVKWKNIAIFTMVEKCANMIQLEDPLLSNIPTNIYTHTT